MKVLISRNKKFFVKDTNQDFHSKEGMIKKEDFAKTKAVTNKGEEFFVLKPEFIDIYERMKRGAQIISLKDVGAIITETGLGKDYKVLDAGLGSAALSIYLARFAKEVTAYEIREDFAKIAMENIKNTGTKNITVKIKDIYEGIDEKNLDLITLDLREPWKAVEHCAKALRRGGFLVAYTPQITQALDFVNAADKTNKFVMVKVKETAEREWQLEGMVAKPITPMLSHTGFLSFMRKI